MLDDSQLSRFRETGLLRLPGAIPAKDTTAMADRIWEHLHGRHGVIRDRQETWTVDQPTGLRAMTAAPEFRALGSATIRAALDDPLGAGRWQPPRRWGRLLVTFPSGDQEWTLPAGAAWHNDFVPLRPGTGERAVQLMSRWAPDDGNQHRAHLTRRHHTGRWLGFPGLMCSLRRGLRHLGGVFSPNMHLKPPRMHALTGPDR